jgi:hypothetical protein
MNRLNGQQAVGAPRASAAQTGVAPKFGKIRVLYAPPQATKLVQKDDGLLRQTDTIIALSMDTDGRDRHLLPDSLRQAADGFQLRHIHTEGINGSSPEDTVLIQTSDQQHSQAVKPTEIESLITTLANRLRKHTLLFTTPVNTSKEAKKSPAFQSAKAAIDDFVALLQQDKPATV